MALDGTNAWGLARRAVEKPAVKDAERLERGVDGLEPVMAASSGCAGRALADSWLPRRVERE